VIRRIFWTSLGIGFGAAAGIAIARQVRRTRDALTPSSLAGSVTGALSGLTDAVRGFGTEIRLGMAEREAELRSGLGLDDPLPDAAGDSADGSGSDVGR
jgi:hypothetical protein